MATIPVTLEFLQSLSDMGKKEALQSAMSWCSTKELRSFCGGMGVRVRSKEYAVYHTKAGYTELLTQLLRSKSATKGITPNLLSEICVPPLSAGITLGGDALDSSLLQLSALIPGRHENVHTPSRFEWQKRPTMVRGGLELGSEVKETVWRELQQCTKRLKRVQEEEKEDAEETEEETLDY
eukprot:jgi/Phyca11/537043/estExt2_fgenesh1_pg.C_PHYCAscaffold_720009